MALDFDFWVSTAMRTMLQPAGFPRGTVAAEYSLSLSMHSTSFAAMTLVLVQKDRRLPDE